MSFKKLPIPVLESLLLCPHTSPEDKEEIKSLLPKTHLTPDSWRQYQKESLEWNRKQQESN